MIQAENNILKPYVIRLSTSSTTQSWLIPPDTLETLVNRSSALDGTIELVDPDTCAVIGSAHTLDRSFVVSAYSGTETTLQVWPEEPPLEQPGIEPNFHGCTP